MIQCAAKGSQWSPKGFGWSWERREGQTPRQHKLANLRTHKLPGSQLGTLECSRQMNSPLAFCVYFSVPTHLISKQSLLLVAELSILVQPFFVLPLVSRFICFCAGNLFITVTLPGMGSFPKEPRRAEILPVTRGELQLSPIEQAHCFHLPLLAFISLLASEVS